MLRRVLEFIAWVARRAWRLGVHVTRKVIAWARRYWRTVARWLARGESFSDILRQILKILGLG